jgi:hypothetical protein
MCFLLGKISWSMKHPATGVNDPVFDFLMQLTILPCLAAGVGGEAGVALEHSREVLRVEEADLLADLVDL